jgi:hypothetical protein
MFAESRLYSVVQWYWTTAPSLVWRRHVGRFEPSRAMLESKHRRGGPTSLTTALETDQLAAEIEELKREYGAAGWEGSATPGPPKPSRS